MTKVERFVRQRGAIKGSCVSERDEYGVARFRFGGGMGKEGAARRSTRGIYCNEFVMMLAPTGERRP